MARPLFPETADGLLDYMAKRFPEPRYDAALSEADLRAAMARRSVYLELRDAYNLSRK